MPSKRNSKAGPAPVAPIPQAKATVAPPAPQIINKSTDNPQPQAMTRKTSMPQAARASPAIEKHSALAQEKVEILSVLMDAGNDWKPRNKVVKHVKPKPKKQSQNITKAPTARPASANLKTRAASVAAKPMTPQPTSAAAITKFKSMNTNHQKEQEEILSVLMDAGKDWKPRNKVVKKFTPKAKMQQVITPALKQTASPASVKPTQKSQAVATAKQSPITPSTVSSQRAPMNATQQEKQEILAVLMDAGSDWKPRNRVVRKVTPKPKTKKRPSTAKKPNKAVPTVTRKASLNRTNSLTDAQKKEKREIMEILLDYYDYVPHLPTRQPLSIQGNVQSAIQFAHDGNSVVVSGTSVENMSGFEEVKSRRTIHKEKKDCKEILNVLVDFKEPQPKYVPLKKNSPPTKTSPRQPKTVDKAAPVPKHIQANKTHVRTKLAT